MRVPRDTLSRRRPGRPLAPRLRPHPEFFRALVRAPITDTELAAAIGYSSAKMVKLLAREVPGTRERRETFRKLARAVNYDGPLFDGEPE